MNNLIKNAIWRSGQSNDPQFFLNTAPISFDQFEINGYRTCSITMQNAFRKAANSYLPYISLCGIRKIGFGYVIRAIEAFDVYLTVSFFNIEQQLLETKSFNIADEINENFRRIIRYFKVPKDANSFKCALIFNGKVTACTFLAPAAYAKC